MRSLVLAFTLGVFGLQQQSELSPVLIYAFGLAVLAIFGVFAWHHHTSASKVAAVKAIEQFSWKTTAIQLLFGFVFGWCWAGSFAHYRLGESLAPNVVGKDFEVTGVITSLPTRSPQGWHFQFTRDGDHENSTEVLLHIPKKLAVSWLDHPQNPPQFSTLQPGQRWHLNLRVKPVHGNANPYGFDYEAWMLEQGLRANASVHSNSEQAGTAKAKLIDEFVWSLSNVVERGRSSLRDRLHLALGGSNNTAYAGVLIALVIGDQSEISQANWTLFNRTGIGHLVSISGLHITMIAGMFASCFGFLWRRSFYFGRDWPLLIPVRKVMVLSAALAALVYVALAGFGVPAQRTLCMLTVVALAVWTGRSSNMSQVLCLALCTVLLFDPWAVLWSGFWLSFAAVAVLLYVGEAATMPIEQAQLSSAELAFGKDSTDLDVALDGVTRNQSLWQKFKLQLANAARAQYAVTLGLVPLTLFLFSQISLVSPIANAIAIPLISFVVTPLALLASVVPLSLAQLLLALAHMCLSGLVDFLQLLNTSGLAIWSAPQPTWWMFVLGMIGLLWMLAPRAWPVRGMGVFCCMPMLVNPVTHPATNHFQVTAFDVGQGTALLIETEHHRLLYDSGPGLNDENNSGLRIIFPYLQGRGIRQLDEMIISHADSDHSGGALSLMKSLPIDTIRSSLDLDHDIVRMAQRHQRCVAGQSWEWDGVYFEILHPVPVIYTSEKWKTNARSCTLRISTSRQSLLLAGDIEAIQEDELINSIPDKLRADVLLVPHHGSGSSSTPAFVQAVQPQYALYQFGYLNRYRHPKPEVWQRYLDFGVIPLRTDTSGAITLQFGDRINIEHYRQTHQRYWYPQ